MAIYCKYKYKLLPRLRPEPSPSCTPSAYNIKDTWHQLHWYLFGGTCAPCTPLCMCMHVSVFLIAHPAES